MTHEADDPTLNLDIDSNWLFDPDYSIAPTDTNLPSLHLDIPYYVDNIEHGKMIQEYAFLNDIPSPIFSVTDLDVSWEIARE
jgi:hypothetical protein